MITIPNIAENPLKSSSENGIVDLADYLFGLFLSISPSAAHAELKVNEESAEWTVSSDRLAPEKIKEISETSIPKRYFRPYLARVGHHYLDGQVYSGSKKMNVSYENRIFELSIELENQNSTGYSVHIETKPVPTSR
ncbi:MAG: hypothetical protein ACSHX4_12665 [Opitutaceae bacterium]